jgi:hypothetical protein
MTTLPVAVVRGISDAADHHKNDEWHARAAAVAAAYAKEMLLQLSPKPILSKYPIFVRIAAPEYPRPELRMKVSTSDS